jgi:hypothetical protein
MSKLRRLRNATQWRQKNFSHDLTNEPFTFVKHDPLAVAAISSHCFSLDGFSRSSTAPRAILMKLQACMACSKIAEIQLADATASDARDAILAHLRAQNERKAKSIS